MTFLISFFVQAHVWGIMWGSCEKSEENVGIDGEYYYHARQYFPTLLQELKNNWQSQIRTLFCHLVVRMILKFVVRSNFSQLYDEEWSAVNQLHLLFCIVLVYTCCRDLYYFIVNNPLKFIIFVDRADFQLRGGHLAQWRLVQVIQSASRSLGLRPE